MDRSKVIFDYDGSHCTSHRVGSDRQWTDLVLVLLLRAFLMNQKRGRQGSHSAQVPTNMRVIDSPKVACKTKKPLFVIPVSSIQIHKGKTHKNLISEKHLL